VKTRTRFSRESLLFIWINRVCRFGGFPWNLIRTFTGRYRTKLYCFAISNEICSSYKIKLPTTNINFPQMFVLIMVQMLFAEGQWQDWWEQYKFNHIMSSNWECWSFQWRWRKLLSSFARLLFVFFKSFRIGK